MPRQGRIEPHKLLYKSAVLTSRLRSSRERLPIGEPLGRGGEGPKARRF